MSSSKSTAEMDTFSDQSSDCEDDENLSTTSISKEVSEVEQTIKFLKDFKPEFKKKPGRKKRNQESVNEDETGENTVISCLDSLLILCKKILSRVACLEKKSSTVLPESNPIRTYSAAVSGSTSRTSHSSTSEAPGSGCMTERFVEYSDRLDQIEQDSFSDTIKIQGQDCHRIISEVSVPQPGSSTTPSTAETGRKIDYVKLKESLASTLDKIVPGVSADNFCDIKLVGRSNIKHIKIKLSSPSLKSVVLSAFKTKKPSDISAYEYLTRNRSQILYKLRNLRGSNNKIKSVYSFSGNVCCKLHNHNKIFTLNTASSYDRFVEGLENPDAASDE